MKLLKTNTKNINNKRLFKEIDDFMMEAFGTLDTYWSNGAHRDDIVEMIDMWMEHYAHETGKIIQFDVRCYPRGNKFHFVLKYRQKNCYNTTEIEYIFKKSSK
ncbi:MAG: hypothetical protein ACXADH_10850 [Candidatus Kariarchaeaceae archaeon]|jgi:hypothetical protein